MGVSPGSFGPWALRCPKVVPRVSGQVFDTLRTLSGHFLDTPEPAAARPREHPVGHSIGPPVFGDTVGDTPQQSLFGTEYDRVKVPPYNGNDPPPAPGSLEALLFPPLLNQVETN